MRIFGKRMLCASAGFAVAAGLMAGSALRPATALTPAGELAPHRAIYELKLAQTRGNATGLGARAHPLRLLRQCLRRLRAAVPPGVGARQRRGQGHAQRSAHDHLGGRRRQEAHLQVAELSQQRLVDSVDGQAERQSDKVAVTLTKPQDKKIDLEAAIVFPTDHVRRIIEAAREGKSILEFPVYDGSETGEKVYNTLTVIGREIAPNERVPTDAAAGQQALAGMKRWPVTVSYFDKAAKSAGEQAPIYSIKFELYENGISRALLLDYNDFAISGELTSLDIKDVKPCQIGGQTLPARSVVR